MSINMIQESQALVLSSIVQGFRLEDLTNNGKYSEWNQLLANVVTGSIGILALDTALKISKCYARFLLSACIVPSLLLGVAHLLKVNEDNKVYKVIKVLHSHVDQVGSLLALVSRVMLIYLGYPVGRMIIDILIISGGLVCAKLAVDLRKSKLFEEKQV